MNYEFLVGGYTRINSKGIYRLNVDLDQRTSNRILVDEISRPTYLIYRDQQVFSTCVVDDVAGVMVYDKTEKALTRKQFLHMDEKNAPAHITLSQDKRFIVTTNYHEGCFVIYKKHEEGYQPYRKVVETRPGSHLHQGLFDESDQFLLTTDLGIDRISVYSTINDFKKLFEIELPDGFGARHCVLIDRYLYCIGEYSHQIAVFNLNNDHGELLQIIDIVDEKLEGSTSAAIRLSNDRTYLYTSIRGQDQISVFKVQEDFLLDKVQELSVEGKHPRDFILTQDNRFLLATNKDSDNVTIFSRAANDGQINFVMEAFCEEGVTIVEIV